MKIYLVGGAVRDQLLGLNVSEKDWVVVGASPQQLLSQGFKQVGKDFPVFLHPKTQEEYALARTEVKTGVGYYGFNCRFSPSVTLEEDLLRRDLTINAMAMDDDGAIIDPYSGKKDLQKRLLRHVSMAFVEDPLRVLRVARFAAKLVDFSVSHETLELMKRMIKELPSLPRERIWKELSRALMMGAPWRFFEVLESIGVLDLFFPKNIDFTIGLKRLCEMSASVDQRFASLFLSSSPAEIKQCSKAVCATNQAKVLALISKDSAKFLASKDRAVAQLQWLWFKRSDALRRPDRFRQALEVVSEPMSSALWMSRVEALIAMDVHPLIKKGLIGKSLGEAIQQEHIKLLEKMA